MKEKFLKVYKKLKFVMLGILLVTLIVLFIPQSIVPFDITYFRTHYAIWLILIFLVSLSSFLYFLLYPIIERTKESIKNSIFETENKLSEIDKQIQELSNEEK